MSTDICVAGYECPANTTKAARSVLRRLAKDRVVVIEYDDGGSNLVVDELESLSGDIGLTFVRLYPGVAILMDEDGFKKFAMDITGRGWDACDEMRADGRLV